MKPIQDVVNDEASQEFLPDYLGAIHGNMDKTVSRIYTSTVTIVVLVVLFELARNSIVSEFSLGPIRISDLSLLQKLVPVAIAYTYYGLASLLATVGLQRALIDAIYAEQYPVYYAHHLEYFYYPTSRVLAEVMIATRATDLQARLALLMRVIIQESIVRVLPVAFLIYAAIVGIIKFGWTDIVLWLGLIVSVILTLQGLLVSATWQKAVYEVESPEGEDTAWWSNAQCRRTAHASTLLLFDRNRSRRRWRPFEESKSRRVEEKSRCPIPMEAES